MTKAKIVITKVGDVMAKARSISHIQRTIVPISSKARSLASKVMLNRRLTTKENDRFICGGPHDCKCLELEKLSHERRKIHKN